LYILFGIALILVGYTGPLAIGAFIIVQLRGAPFPDFASIAPVFALLMIPSTPIIWLGRWISRDGCKFETPYAVILGVLPGFAVIYGWKIFTAGKQLREKDKRGLGSNLDL